MASDGWLHFDGWEAPHTGADHPPLHIAVQGCYIVAIRQVRDEDSVLIHTTEGHTYRTAASFEALCEQMAPAPARPAAPPREVPSRAVPPVPRPAAEEAPARPAAPPAPKP